MKHFTCIHISWFMLTCDIIPGMFCIKLIQVSAPEFVHKGQSAKLHCDFDLEGDRLYSVKWYKEQHEFFRYIPNETPPAQAFNYQGVNVDVSLSGKHHLVLKSVSLDATGRYRCEVSADAPSFSTVIGHVDFVVVVIPQQAPFITGLKAKYKIGSAVSLNCTSPGSKPASSLMWYINDVKAGRNNLMEYVPIVQEDGLETSRLGLDIIITKKSFLPHSNSIELKCTSTVAKTYSESVERICIPEDKFPVIRSKMVLTSGGKELEASFVCPLIFLLSSCLIKRHI